jgi:Secretion system C-terminal sorting domain
LQFYFIACIFAATVAGNKAAILTAVNNPANWTVSSGAVVIYTGSISFTALPIELIHFEGSKREGQNLLTWATASETQNKGFDIERSTYGSRFEKIGFVAGNGTTSKTQRYTFKDDKSPNGVTYYRLKQLDFDGRSEYSKTIVITRKAKDAVSVYPNPTEGVLNISAGDYEQAFVIVNSIGQVVLQGEQLDKTINLQSLPSGFYYLKIGAQTMKVVKE